MSMERHDQEVSLDQLGAISAGIRAGFMLDQSILQERLESHIGLGQLVLMSGL